MITLTREEAQQAVESLTEALDAQQWEIDNHIKAYGEWFRPRRVEYMKNVLDNTLRMIEVLSHKLNEPTIDGWPLYSGLAQRKWQELSDYEVDNIVRASSGRESAVYLAEAKLKEKNG